MTRRRFLVRLAGLVAWPVVIGHHRPGHRRGRKPRPTGLFDPAVFDPAIFGGG